MRTSRFPLLPMLVLFYLLFAGSSAAQNAGILGEIPPRFHEGVERAMLGENDGELRSSFAKLMTAEERLAWAFLVATLPTESVGLLTEEMLTEQVMYADLARSSLPWSKGLPKEIFRHYVLPFVLERGKPQSGRRGRYEEVVPLLRGKRATTLEKAALKLNRICAGRRDLGPLPEDRARSFVRLARAAGIPARVAETPFWTVKAGGETWCEVYDGKRWRYLEPGKPADKLDQTSFSKDLSRVAIVLSQTIGRPEDGEVLTTEAGISTVNSTGLYTKTCRMTVEVRDANGDPAGAAKFALNIFNEEGNNAYLRTAFSTRTDLDGRFTFELGPGDYLFSASSGGEVGWAAARSVPGGKATCPIVVRPPVTDPSSEYVNTGSTALQVHMGGGGGGDMTAALARLKIIPWFFFGFVGGGGQTAELEPGFYTVSTSWRRNETTVLVSVQAVQLRPGETVTVTTPNFPKSARKPEAGTNAWILSYPRR